MDCYNENKDDDKDSVISERCWEEKYRGDSRKWIVRDGSSKKARGMICSSMKESFTFPEIDERQFKGIRRKILEQKLLEEVAQEIIDENNNPPPVEEYCTEYDGNFHYPGYDPNKKKERNTELYLKYPLYNSPAITCYQYQMNKQIREKVTMRGLTISRDPKNPFKRNSEFSKRISEVLDKDFL